MTSVRSNQPWSVEFTVETTKDEIVDVAAADAKRPMAACLDEAVWAVWLDARFDHEREQFSFTLRGPASR